MAGYLFTLTPPASPAAVGRYTLVRHCSYLTASSISSSRCARRTVRPLEYLLAATCALGAPPAVFFGFFDPKNPLPTLASPASSPPVSPKRSPTAAWIIVKASGFELTMGSPICWMRNSGAKTLKATCLSSSCRHPSRPSSSVSAHWQSMRNVCSSCSRSASARSADLAAMIGSRSSKGKSKISSELTSSAKWSRANAAAGLVSAWRDRYTPVSRTLFQLSSVSFPVV